MQYLDVDFIVVDKQIFHGGPVYYIGIKPRCLVDSSSSSRIDGLSRCMLWHLFDFLLGPRCRSLRVFFVPGRRLRARILRVVCRAWRPIGRQARKIRRPLGRAP